MYQSVGRGYQELEAGGEWKRNLEEENKLRGPLLSLCLQMKPSQPGEAQRHSRVFMDKKRSKVLPEANALEFCRSSLQRAQPHCANERLQAAPELLSAVATQDGSFLTLWT